MVSLALAFDYFSLPWLPYLNEIKAANGCRNKTGVSEETKRVPKKKCDDEGTSVRVIKQGQLAHCGRKGKSQEKRPIECEVEC